MNLLATHPLTYLNRHRLLVGLCCFVIAAGLSCGTVAAQPATPNGGTTALATATSSPSEEPFITITVTDSTGATANATTPITIATGGLARFDATGDGTIDRDEAVAAVSTFNGDETLGGEAVTRDNAVDVISAFNSGEPIGA